jgi:hypothetical protein
MCMNTTHPLTWRAGDLRGLQGALGHEPVDRLLLVGREVLEEALLHVADGVHAHLDGVDALVREAGVEQLAWRK